MDPAPRKPDKEELRTRAAAVRLVVLDCDGVLTEGGLYYGEAGELMKRFDVKDGHALVFARHAGLPAAVLTARSSRILEVRARELGLPHVLQGQRDKARGLATLLAQTGLPPEACAYMGDDLNDLPVLTRVGLSACPADAVPEVRARVHFVSDKPGGRGAVRDLLELCLRAQGKWEAVISEMLDKGSHT